MKLQPRRKLAFRDVNRPGQPGYDPQLQRHHLLPRQLLSLGGFRQLIERLGTCRIGFDDFRANGLMLPCAEEAARRLALPLHRGPHRDYNRVVIERFAQIEQGYSASCAAHPRSAAIDAAFRIRLLQRGLRKRLLAPRNKAFRLNSMDPLGTGFDFAELDAMAEALWRDTQPEVLACSASMAD